MAKAVDWKQTAARLRFLGDEADMVHGRGGVGGEAESRRGEGVVRWPAAERGVVGRREQGKTFQPFPLFHPEGVRPRVRHENRERKKSRTRHDAPKYGMPGSPIVPFRKLRTFVISSKKTHTRPFKLPTGEQ